jgi:TolB-like protein
MDWDEFSGFVSRPGNSDRFPTVIGAAADIPQHQLGWRMAVLPFHSTDGVIGVKIAFGMAEEISAAVSRFRSPRLLAPVTFWDGHGPSLDAVGRCKLYQLDYMMEGTIDSVGDRIVVNVVIQDVVLDFEVVWTGCFHGSCTDLFSIQERIANEAVRQLDPDLHGRGPGSNAPTRTEVSEAHWLVLDAIQSINRLDRSAFMGAKVLLEKASILDPGYAAPATWLAYWSIMAVGQGWVSNPAEIIAVAGTSADQAVELDPFDARAVAIAGHVKGYLMHDLDSALRYHAKAIDLDPNLAIAWSLSACSKFYNGDHATAIRHATNAHSLSPRDPHIFFTEHVLTTAYFFKGDLEIAARFAERVATRNPGHASALNVQLAIYGHMGRFEDARLCLAELRKLDPAVTVSSIASRAPIRDKDREFYARGLYLAGVPI